PAPLNYNCIYCGEHDHSIRRCPKVEEDIRAGRCKRNAEGQVVLPGGAMVSRSVPGATMRDRILEWHRQNPGQTSVHLLDTMLWEEVRASAAPQTTDMFHLDQRERIEALERELFALRGKGKQVFDGVYVPPPNRSSNPSKESGVGPTGPAPSRAKSQTVREQPVAEAVRPAINRESPPHMSEGPIHPFAGARDVNRPRQAIPRSVEKGSAQAADASQAKEPAYRTQAPVYNPRISDLVFERSLKTPNISLTSEELLSIAPEVRAKYRDIVTPKKVPAPPAIRLQATIQEVEDEDDGPELPDVEQLIHSGSSIRPGVLVVPDPYEIYLRSLGPGETPKQLVVAKESHALRSIMGLIDNQEKVEAILDPGSQIVAMSEAVCHSLGLQYDPTIQLQMQSANKTIDMSLGLAHNIPFQVGDITVYLQIHVIRDPAYDILLGRPFDVLTESCIKNFKNEDQTITINDPNSGIVSTIPTFPRG
ncbi:hypothetical protein GLOTRDRAFT_23852, partial [Gloeophyllum trabeum ATCC 11539]